MLKRITGSIVGGSTQNNVLPVTVAQCTKTVHKRDNSVVQTNNSNVVASREEFCYVVLAV